MATTKQLEKLTRDELYERAKEADIPGRSQMDKDELIRALSRANGRAGGDGRVGDRSLDRSTTSKRSIWKGSITFGLITIPVGLYTAVEDRDISFRLLSADDGSRIRYKRVSAETGEEVDWDDIVKGYEYEKGRYVTFTREELERIPSDSVHAVDVVQFAGAEEIDPIYFDRSYYVAPEASAVKPYRLFARALADTERLAIGKVTIREKEKLCAIRSQDGVLVLETMNWPDEVRIPAFDELEQATEVSDRELEMAEQLIDGLTSEFDPTRFHDSYRERLEEAIAAKIEGDEIQLAPEEPERGQVKDLMEALRASVEATQRRRSA